MPRALLIVCLLSSCMFAADCPKPPDPPLQCPDGCQTMSGNNCQVDTNWLLKYENCVESSAVHRAIELAPGDLYTIIKPSSTFPDFAVQDFKSYDLVINNGVISCDLKGGTPSHVTDAFKDSTTGAARKHILTAQKEGCFKVNLSFTVDGNPCTIDPHIIVRQVSPVARHHKTPKSPGDAAAKQSQQQE